MIGELHQEIKELMADNQTLKQWQKDALPIMKKCLRQLKKNYKYQSDLRKTNNEFYNIEDLQSLIQSTEGEK